MEKYVLLLSTIYVQTKNFDRFWVESVSTANLNEVYYAPVYLITSGKSSNK